MSGYFCNIGKTKFYLDVDLSRPLFYWIFKPETFKLHSVKLKMTFYKVSFHIRAANLFVWREKIQRRKTLFVSRILLILCPLGAWRLTLRGELCWPWSWSESELSEDCSLVAMFFMSRLTAVLDIIMITDSFTFGDCSHMTSSYHSFPFKKYVLWRLSVLCTTVAIWYRLD